MLGTVATFVLAAVVIMGAISPHSPVHAQPPDTFSVTDKYDKVQQEAATQWQRDIQQCQQIRESGKKNPDRRAVEATAQQCEQSARDRYQQKMRQLPAPSAGGNPNPPATGPTIFDQPVTAGTLKPISDPSGTYAVYLRPQPKNPQTRYRGTQTLTFDRNTGRLTVASESGSTAYYQYVGAKQQKYPGGATESLDMYNSTKETILLLKTQPYTVFVEDSRGSGRYVTVSAYTLYTYPLNQTNKLPNVFIL